MVAPASNVEIFGLDGVSTYSAPIFARDASFPITNAKPYRPNNEVAEMMPVFMGWWEDNMVAPSLSAQEIEIDISNIADDCDAAVVRASASSFDYIAPNMRLVPLKSPVIKIDEILRPFARQRSIATETLLHQVFDLSGRFIEGTPYRQHILRTAYATLQRSAEWIFTKYAQTGDYANSILEVDGLYTQLDNGWTAGDVDGGDAHNIAQEINWYYLCTESVAATATGFASPDAVTLAGKTVTIHGVEKTVPAGLNLAKFLEEIWFDYLITNHIDRYGDPVWEMHIRPGERYRFIDSVVCMQPCNNDLNYDLTVRSRWVEHHQKNRMTLLPTGKEVTLMQTPDIAEGVVYIGPRSIGGNPTYGLFFQPLTRYFAEALIEHNMMYGQSAGLVNVEEPLIWEDETFIKKNFESMAFISDYTKISQTCLEVGTQFKYGMLATQRHLWLKLTGCSAQSTFITDPGSTVTVVS